MSDDSAPSTPRRPRSGRNPRPLPALRRRQAVRRFSSLSKRCANCGLDYGFADSGDGPAVFVILIIGFIVVGLALWMEVDRRARRSGCISCSGSR